MIERAIILKIQKEQPNVQLFIKLILMINRIYYPQMIAITVFSSTLLLFLNVSICKVASTIRARFAQVTQNPLCVFSLLGNLDGDSASPFPRFLTQQAVFFGFYIEYSRSVMVPITRKDKTWQDQKSKRN